LITNEKIKHILTTDVVSVHVKQKLSDVNEIFRENMIHHIPVLDGKYPIGIISTKDILKLIFNIDTQDERMIDAIMDHNFTIKKVMTKDLITLPISSTIKDAANVLRFSSILSIIVTNKRGEMEGIVTSTDLIQYLYDNLN